MIPDVEKTVKVTPCCKTRHWHYVNEVGVPDLAVVRCEICKETMAAELLEEVIKGLNPVTHFCDKCGISAEIISRQHSD